jgi:hypothetical protein
VIENTCVPDPRKPSTLEYSPRLMLTEQKNLYCDQSAILMATIIGGLRRDHSPVALVGDDGVTRHTILEMQQKDGWKTYDTLNRRQGKTYEQILRRLPYHALPVRRRYVGSRWMTRKLLFAAPLARAQRPWEGLSGQLIGGVAQSNRYCALKEGELGEKVDHAVGAHRDGEADQSVAEEDRDL